MIKSDYKHANVKTTIVIVLLLVILVPLGLFLYSWYRLHGKLNRHVPETAELILRYPLPLKEHQFKTSDGILLSAWYVPKDSAKLIIILVHGFGGQTGGKTQMLEYADFLYKAGYASFLVDLRAYGKSQGNKTTLGVNEWRDLEAAFNYVKSLPEGKDKAVGFLGVSIGAYTAIITTGITGKGDFVIVATPYASINKLFAAQIRKEGFPATLFLPFIKLAAVVELGKDYHHYSAEKSVRNIKAPIFIISAVRDNDVNPADGKYLFSLANEPKEYWQADTGHEVFIEEPDKFTSRVLAFLSSSEIYHQVWSMP